MSVRRRGRNRCRRDGRRARRRRRGHRRSGQFVDWTTYALLPSGVTATAVGLPGTGMVAITVRCREVDPADRVAGLVGDHGEAAGPGSRCPSATFPPGSCPRGHVRGTEHLNDVQRLIGDVDHRLSADQCRQGQEASGREAGESLSRVQCEYSCNSRHALGPAWRIGYRGGRRLRRGSKKAPRP